MSEGVKSFLRRVARWYGIHGPSMGKTRIVQAAVPYLTLRDAPIVDVKSPHGFEMSLDLSEAIQRQAYFFGYFEAFIVPVFVDWVKPGSVVLDGGANFGQFSLLSATLVGRDGLVVACEPAPATFEALQRNAKLNGFTQLLCRNVALSDITGSALLYVPPESDSGTASLSRRAVEPYHREVKVVNASVVRIDELLSPELLGGRRVSMIKLDIQGAELAALRGAKSIVQSHRPVLVLEADETATLAFGYSVGDLCVAVQAMGYALFGVSPPAGASRVPFDPESELSVPHDLVCLPCS